MNNLFFLLLNLLYFLNSFLFLFKTCLHDHSENLLFLFLFLLKCLLSFHRGFKCQLVILLLYPKKFWINLLGYLWLGLCLCLTPFLCLFLSLLFSSFSLYPLLFFLSRFLFQLLLLLLQHHLECLLI